MKMKKQNLLLLILAAMLLFAGCGKETADTEETEIEETVFYTDDAGREVELPEEIDKVVTLGSTGQIMMISLAPDMLLGINTPIEREPEEYLEFDITELPVIGQ